jgi:hypothetical protein
MTTNTRINGKVLWHVHGEKARVINFKDILTRDEIMKKYGPIVSARYMTEEHGGPVCLFIPNDSDNKPYIRLIYSSLKVAKSIDGTLNVVSEAKYDFQKITIWDEIPIEGMKIVDDLVSQANDHLNEIIESIDPHLRQDLER